MNKRDHLLAETLGTYDGARFARQAAAQVRRRRLLKHVATGTAALAAALAVLVTLRQPPPVSPVPTTPGPAVAATLEIISDEELLAALEYDPVLFTKNPDGVTDIVFLADASPD